MGRWQSSCRRRSVFGCRVSSGSCRSSLSRPLECVEEQRAGGGRKEETERVFDSREH